MEGLTASRDAPADALSDARATIAAAVSAACGLVAASAAAMLLERRLAGALGPTGMPAIACTAAVGLLLVMLGDLAVLGPASHGAVRSALPWPRGHSGAVRSRWSFIATRLGLLVAVAAVALPAQDGSSLGVIGRILMLAGVLAAAGPGIVGVRRRPTGAPDSGGPRVRPALGQTAFVAGGGPATGDGQPLLPPPPSLATNLAVAGSAVLQRLERLAMPDGTECVRGTVAVLVQRGARSGTAHLGFCPPFVGQPTVEVGSDYDAVEAVISAAEVVPWGVRVECRLDEPAEETIEIPVTVVARAPA